MADQQSEYDKNLIAIKEEDMCRCQSCSISLEELKALKCKVDSKEENSNEFAKSFDFNLLNHVLETEIEEIEKIVNNFQDHLMQESERHNECVSLIVANEELSQETESRFIEMKDDIKGKLALSLNESTEKTTELESEISQLNKELLRSKEKNKLQQNQINILLNQLKEESIKYLYLKEYNDNQLNSVLKRKREMELTIKATLLRNEQLKYENDSISSKEIKQKEQLIDSEKSKLILNNITDIVKIQQKSQSLQMEIEQCKQMIEKKINENEQLAKSATANEKQKLLGEEKKLEESINNSNFMINLVKNEIENVEMKKKINAKLIKKLEKNCEKIKRKTLNLNDSSILTDDSDASISRHTTKELDLEETDDSSTLSSMQSSLSPEI